MRTPKRRVSFESRLSRRKYAFVFSPPWRVLQIWRFLGVDTKSFAPQRLHRGSKLVRPSASIMDPSNPFQRFSQETNTIEELSTTSLVRATNQSVSTAEVLSALRHNNNDDSDDHATNSHDTSIQPVQLASPFPINNPHALALLEQPILLSFTDWQAAHSATYLPSHHVSSASCPRHRWWEVRRASRRWFSLWSHHCPFPYHAFVKALSDTKLLIRFKSVCGRRILQIEQLRDSLNIILWFKCNSNVHGHSCVNKEKE